MMYNQTMKNPEEDKKKEHEPLTEIEAVEQNQLPQDSSTTQKPAMTLQQAIDFGEYHPEFLQNFPEWHTLTPHIQWQYVRKALDIKRKQLWTQYNELCSVLDIRLKSNVQESIKNVEKQIADLAKDRERLYVEFTNKF